MLDTTIPDGIFINWSDTYSKYKKLSPEIVEILGNHQAWINRGWTGKGRANLEGVDFRGANLRGVNLAGANLRGANLRGANLRGAVVDEDALDTMDITDGQRESLNIV